MADDTHFVSRRNALKGIAAVAGTSVAGAGAIIQASEPAAANGHLMSIDDITIETTSGEISEFGISDIWYEVSWENVSESLGFQFRFRPEDSGSDHILDYVSVNVSNNGTSTFGYGSQYSENYDVDLSEEMDVPLRTTEDTWLQEYLSLDDDENQRTVQDMKFGMRVFHEINSDEIESLDITSSLFNVTVQRIVAEGSVDEGEGEAYGED